MTDRAQLAELSKVWRSAGHVAGSAATIALVAPVLEDERRRAGVRYDLGQATMAMMLAAADLGIPEDRYCAYLIALGYPADRPLTTIRRPDRRPFEDVVHWDRW